MKKIITLCSVILVLALIVTAFTACGDKTEDETTTTTTQGVSSEESGFTVEIGDTEAVVKKDGKDFQTLKYPINSGVQFDLNYAKKNNAFLDMNFDGEPDFYIAISSVDGVINYYCWLYNATSKQFDYSVILSALKNISVDAYDQRVLSNIVVDGEEHVFSYKWVDGQLLLDTDYSEENGGIPEEVTQAVNDNVIGVEKTTSANSDKTETTKKNSSDSSDNKTTTRANKPANTTTTSPNLSSGGVVLETGNMSSGGWY